MYEIIEVFRHEMTLYDQTEYRIDYIMDTGEEVSFSTNVSNYSAIDSSWTPMEGLLKTATSHDKSLGVALLKWLTKNYNYQPPAAPVVPDGAVDIISVNASKHNDFPMFIVSYMTKGSNAHYQVLTVVKPDDLKFEDYSGHIIELLQDEYPGVVKALRKYFLKYGTKWMDNVLTVEHEYDTAELDGLTKQFLTGTKLSLNGEPFVPYWYHADHSNHIHVAISPAVTHMYDNGGNLLSVQTKVFDNTEPPEVAELPGIHEMVNHPAGSHAACEYSQYKRCELRSMIMHLNDYHQWTRESIADWLETLDIDLRFKSPDDKLRDEKAKQIKTLQQSIENLKESINQWNTQMKVAKSKMDECKSKLNQLQEEQNEQVG